MGIFKWGEGGGVKKDGLLLGYILHYPVTYITYELVNFFGNRKNLACWFKEKGKSIILFKSFNSLLILLKPILETFDLMPSNKFYINCIEVKTLKFIFLPH